MERVEMGEEGRACQFEKEYGELEIAVEEKFHQDSAEILGVADSSEHIVF